MPPQSIVFDVAVALVGVVGALVLHRVMRKLPVPPQAPDSQTNRNMPAIAQLAMGEYSAWLLPSLIGFVAFMGGAPWLAIIGGLSVTGLGFAFSFPRWSDWSAVADDIDARDLAAPHRTSAST